MLSEVVASQQRSPLSLLSDTPVAACIVQTRLKTPYPRVCDEAGSTSAHASKT